MTLDAHARAAFDREIRATPQPLPTDLEIGLALDAISTLQRKPQPGPMRSGARDIAQYLAPACALAAACLIAALSGRPGTVLPRPLATELARTLPGDTGTRFTLFIILAGDSLRSAGR
ncbi:MAG TPA: hypothetical protein VMX33_09425 [bacterium]|nr:hypothetical protein [bacterium]